MSTLIGIGNFIYSNPVIAEGGEPPAPGANDAEWTSGVDIEWSGSVTLEWS